MAVTREAHAPTTWLNRLWPAAFGLAFAAVNLIGLAVAISARTSWWRDCSRTRHGTRTTTASEKSFPVR